MDHTNMLFYDQHILKLPDVVKLKTAIIMFKAFHNLLSVNVQQFFSIYESAYTTRQNCHFKHYYSRTTLKGMCISITGVKLWNSLENCLINCRNVHLFKKYYTNRLLKSYVPVCTYGLIMMLLDRKLHNCYLCSIRPLIEKTTC